MFDEIIWFTSYELHVKYTELIMYRVELVDDCPYPADFLKI